MYWTFISKKKKKCKAKNSYPEVILIKKCIEHLYQTKIVFEELRFYSFTNKTTAGFV